MELRSRRTVEAYLVTPEEPAKSRHESDTEPKETFTAKEERSETTSVFSPAYSDIAATDTTKKTGVVNTYNFN